MNIVASGTSGTIGKHLGPIVKPLNQRLDFISEEELNIRKEDTYIHLGALVGPQAVQENARTSKIVNIDSTVRLAEHCLTIDAKKFVFISTAHVYAPSFDDKTENSEIEPVNIYAQQKYDAEIKLRQVFEGNEDKLLILRVFSILDWDTKPFTLGGGLHKVLSDPNYILNCGDDVRDFLTPKQTADAILKITQRNTSTSLLNLCTGIGVSISHAAKLMLTDRIPIDWSQRILPGTSDFPRLVGNPSNITRELGTTLKWRYLQG